MKEKITNDKGFTLVELIIALAIMAILGAIIVPNFITSTDKARLKSDIQSARVIQSAINLHDAEHSEALKGTMSEIMTALKQQDYISSNTGETTQSAGAAWELKPDGTVVVNITGCEAKIQAQYEKLTTQEQRMVVK